MGTAEAEALLRAANATLESLRAERTAGTDNAPGAKREAFKAWAAATSAVRSARDSEAK